MGKSDNQLVNSEIKGQLLFRVNWVYSYRFVLWMLAKQECKFLRAIIFMIDNILLNNQPNVQKEQQSSLQLQKGQKVVIQQQKPKHIPPKVQQDILQQSPKVIRNSSSQYDKVLQKFYFSQQNDAKSTLKEGKNHREFRQQLTYIRDSSTNTILSAYFIATKESNTGVLTHQRFFIINLQTKELTYYPNLPYLPLKSIQQISQKPKQIIKLKTAQKLTISNPKKGIGQLQIRWIQNSSTKLWNIKLGNNAMTKQFISIVDAIRFDKQVVVDEKYKSKEKIIKDFYSPKNKSSINNKGVKKKENAVNSGASNLSNLLLKSIVAPQEFPQGPKVKEKKDHQKEKTAKKQPNSDSLKLESSPYTFQKPKQSNQNQIFKQITVMKDEQQAKNAKKESGMHEAAFAIKEQKKEYLQARQNKTQEVQVKMPKLKQEAGTTNHKNPYQMQKYPEQMNQKVEALKVQNTTLKPNKSIRIQEIIRNASIQYQEKQSVPLEQINTPTLPISLIQQQKPRKSHLQAVVQRRRQLQQESIQTQKTVSQQKQMQLSKVIIQNIHKTTNSKSSLSNSKIHTGNTKEQNKFSKSRPKEDIQYHQSMAKPQPKIRQNFLEERKYAYTVKMPDIKPPKIINQHSHPRRQKSRSSSVSNNIEDYILKQKQNQQNQKDWLFKWLTTVNPLERGNLYYKIVNQFKTRVVGLTKKFDDWHLFHKEGEKYIAKEGEIQLNYSMLTSTTRIQQFLNQQSAQIRKIRELCYLWNMTDAGKQISSQYPVVIGATCVIQCKGLRVFCKLDISSSKLKYKDVSQSIQYEPLLAEISRKCHSRIRNISLFEFTLGKQTYLYIDQIEVQPFNEMHSYFVNENYVKSYVAGIITLPEHLQQIHQHYLKGLFPEFIALLQQFTPLTTLQLQAEMDKLGLDMSFLPLIYEYCGVNQKNRQFRFVLSQLCTQLLAQNLRNDIHCLLLSKNTEKNIQEQIYSMLMKNLRWDNDSICQQFWIKFKIKVSLGQIRDQIVDEYVISSLLIKLGIKCSLKQQTDVQEVEKKKGCFWRQFQFSEQTVSVKWESITHNFSPLPLHQLKAYFSQLFSMKEGRLPENQYLYNRRHLIQLLSLVNKQPYQQTWFFCLLTLYQKQLINSLISKQESVFVSADWQQQNHPFYHLNHYTSAYYYTNMSFDQTLTPLRQLINKHCYQQAHRLLQGQLVRAWIWGSHSSKLLVKIELLRSDINQLMGNQSQSLQSILLAFQIAIKRYQERQIRIINVLQLCYRAAGLHARYHKYRKAVELYEMCGKMFEKAVQQQEHQTMLFQRYLFLFNQKTRLQLKLGEFQNAEQSAKANLVSFFNWKDQLDSQKTEILSLIYRQQFEGYSILFRVYELFGKYIEQIQLMQDCSVKFIQNYLELLIGQDDAKTFVQGFQQLYCLEILKNVWLAVISNSNHAKIPSYQQYFNYYYSPLRSIKLQVIIEILIKLKKVHKGSTPFEKHQATERLFEVLLKKIKQLNQKDNDEDERQRKSILVIGVIDCLSLLSSSQNVLLQKTRTSQIHELQIFQQIVSIIGFEFAIGALKISMTAFDQDQ